MTCAGCASRCISSPAAITARPTTAERPSGHRIRIVCSRRSSPPEISAFAAQNFRTPRRRLCDGWSGVRLRKSSRRANARRPRSGSMCRTMTWTRSRAPGERQGTGKAAKRAPHRQRSASPPTGRRCDGPLSLADRGFRMAIGASACRNSVRRGGASACARSGHRSRGRARPHSGQR